MNDGFFSKFQWSCGTNCSNRKNIPVAISAPDLGTALSLLLDWLALYEYQQKWWGCRSARSMSLNNKIGEGVSNFSVSDYSSCLLPLLLRHSPSPFLFLFVD